MDEMLRLRWPAHASGPKAPRRHHLGPLLCQVALACALLGACATPVPTPTPPAPTANPAAAPPAATPEPALELPATAAPVAEPAETFSYDAQAPLAVEEIGSTREGQATVRDIAFASPHGDKVPAYLVLPEGEGPYPAVLYVHWLGTAETSNRKEFLPEAIGLAEEGVVSLLVDDLFALPKMRRRWTGSDPVEDREIVIQQIVELRRALDLLTSQPEVDPQRIAFVGHDFGGMFGAVLAGVDPRVKTWVLMTPAADFSDWFLIGSTTAGEKRENYRAALAPLAPALHLARTAPASIFFQFAKSDPYVSGEAADRLFAAASEPKREEHYATGHALHREETATYDRLEWLRAELGLPPRPE